PVGLLKAPELMTVVPYRTLAEIWSGYAKNLVDGAGGAKPALSLAAVVFLGAVLPFAWVLASLVASLVELAFARSSGNQLTGVGIEYFSSPTSLAALIACVAAIAFRWSTADVFHHPRRDAFLHPVANALFVALLIDAVRRRARGVPVLWKDRPV
ncbi:MAG TPA: hypothetical protein VLV15_04460, partial [Dongiaceae bacterium]|nr:hypothetical protein [Dongiaceae bacterium]